MQRGRFIALEGIDGSGTTSQAKAVAAGLQARGHRVLVTHEPSGGSIGRLVRHHLAHSASRLDPAAMALLFAADRIDHVRTWIEPALDRGEVVLTDRYLVSSWVYQSLECDAAWIRTINDHAPWPDLTLVLDLPVETALARVHARSNGNELEIYESTPVQERVRAAYEAVLAETHEGMLRIDATQSFEAVTQDLLERCIALGL